MTRKAKPIDQEEMLAAFRYVPGFGSLIRRGVGKTSTKVAGHIKDTGYVTVHVNGVNYMVHRVIWTMFYGPIPENMIVDHINTIRHDNRIENLRLATPSQNSKNMKKAKNNISGTKGIRLLKPSGNKQPRWQAGYTVDGHYRCAYFGIKSEAIEWLRKGREREHGEFSNDGELND